MLTLLELRDFTLIEQLELRLAPGLNALTGETGAGKSIIIDALVQLSGARADLGLIRAGRESALIQGEFGHDGSSISLGRRLQSAGRNTARLNGELVSLGELARAASGLIGIHGQHAAQELQDASRHARLLDRLLDKEGRQASSAWSAAYGRLRAAREELAQLAGSAAERARRLDTIDWQLAEINEAAIRPGEEEALRQELSGLRHADAITSGASQAVALLQEDDAAVLALLMQAERALAAAARHGEGLVPLAAELTAAREALQATTSEIEAFLADFQAEPDRLEHVESRLAVIEAAKRKYGSTVDEVLAFRDALQDEKEQLAQAEERVEELTRTMGRLTAELDSAGADLTKARQSAAGRLEAGVAPHLASLGMAEARFSVAFTPLPEPVALGPERVQFRFSANPGEPLADLAQTASGGELSRLLLAVSLVAGAEQPVLVFDEVDAGTGGRAAVAIGRLLQQLARDRQVLVVTHLPQVAAFAHAQFHVSKHLQDDRTVTRVTRLDGAGRRQELARMLSGDVTDAALDAADELLSAAAQPNDGQVADRKRTKV